MNKIFKYLGALSIAGAIGLNAMNVSAELQCAADETVHTNYYMFLDVQASSDYKRLIEAATSTKPYTQWNGAKKYNNIKNSTQGENGDVNITMGSKSTNSGAPMSWTVEEFWEKFYRAYYNKDSHNVYEDATNNTSYMTHETWVSYGDNWTSPQDKSHANTERMDRLMDHLRDNMSNIGNSTLVRSGTSIPKTEITAPADLWTSLNDEYEFRVKRTFSTDDIKEGIPLNNTNWTYSPAVHFARFCVKNTNNPQPSTKKTITYDMNTTDPVSNPTPNDEFTGCTNIRPASIETGPKRTGWTFLGWSTNASSTLPDSQYALGKQYCDESITLHAVWSKDQTGPYKVEYNANGGKGAPATQNGQSGQTINLSTQKPTLAGNNFLGWSRDSKAKEPDPMFDPGDPYDGKLGDITLYAVWQTQTGVSAHLIAFAAVAIGAGVALVVAKKKNLFRQI